MIRHAAFFYSKRLGAQLARAWLPLKHPKVKAGIDDSLKQSLSALIECQNATKCAILLT